MFCPRCGSENREGDRYCSSCGAELPRPDAGPAEQKSLRERLAALIGTSRSARLLTAGTAGALLLAVVAFVALPADDDEIPQDAYTLAADQLCVSQKRAIVAMGSEALSGGGGLAAYASGLVPIVVEWRSALNELSPPADRVPLAEELSLALRKVAVEAGALGRLARTGGQEEVVAYAERVDKATGGVEEAIANLGLTRCDQMGIALAAGNG
ncbi:MAG TPA: zinc ribbon domain-containing protein [Solirubrobacterales bacterium]|nr:zinc ribbon domain-containing protein [Solirubrobacterales bacterium]